METVLVYDGTFDGFLTAVFETYYQKLQQVQIQSEEAAKAVLFGKMQHVTTDLDKSERVATKLQTLDKGSGFRLFYRAFLSEQERIENDLLAIIRRSLKIGTVPSGDLGDPSVLRINQASKILGREKHRMEAFIRFHLIEENIYFANCEPDCNVLPVISSHFKNRYADQKWVIYDLKRDYGISYDLQEVHEVKIDFRESDGKTKGIINDTGVGRSRFRESENNYRDLWNQYFKSTNIESRKNMKLHLQHVPKRYWKYLSEKV
jgi:probable DNA metabolism protein